jgi:hypothetical protein
MGSRCQQSKNNPYAVAIMGLIRFAGHHPGAGHRRRPAASSLMGLLAMSSVSDDSACVSHHVCHRMVTAWTLRCSYGESCENARFNRYKILIHVQYMTLLSTTWKSM